MLIFACRWGHLDFVKHFLKNIDDIHEYFNIDNFLAPAEESGNAELVEYLEELRDN